MSKAGAVMVSNPVTVPFFDPSATLNLPLELEELLLEALQAQVRTTSAWNILFRQKYLNYLLFSV
jgi:Fungal tRNA ligase phosphodiesterase domain